jgi:hypothetical protein
MSCCISAMMLLKLKASRGGSFASSPRWDFLLPLWRAILSTVPFRLGRQLDTFGVMDAEPRDILRLAGRLAADEGGGPEYVRTMTGCE